MMYGQAFPTLGESVLDSFSSFNHHATLTPLEKESEEENNSLTLKDSEEITDLDLIQAAQTLDKVQKISLNRLINITDRSIIFLATRISPEFLEKIEFTGCPRVSKHAFHDLLYAIRLCRNLKEIVFGPLPIECVEFLLYTIRNSTWKLNCLELCGAISAKPPFIVVHRNLTLPFFDKTADQIEENRNEEVVQRENSWYSRVHELKEHQEFKNCKTLRIQQDSPARNQKVKVMVYEILRSQSSLVRARIDLHQANIEESNSLEEIAQHNRQSILQTLKSSEFHSRLTKELARRFRR